MNENSHGHEHYARRIAQAASARRMRNRMREEKYPGKGSRNNWKKEV
jgi:hypothetical protein